MAHHAGDHGLVLIDAPDPAGKHSGDSRNPQRVLPGFAGDAGEVRQVPCLTI